MDAKTLLFCDLGLSHALLRLSHRVKLSVPNICNVHTYRKAVSRCRQGESQDVLALRHRTELRRRRIRKVRVLAFSLNKP